MDIVTQLRKVAESYASAISNGPGQHPLDYLEGKAADKIERYRAAMSWLAGHEPELIEQAREKYKVE